MSNKTWKVCMDFRSHVQHLIQKSIHQTHWMFVKNTLACYINKTQIKKRGKTEVAIFKRQKVIRYGWRGLNELNNNNKKKLNQQRQLSVLAEDLKAPQITKFVLRVFQKANIRIDWTQIYFKQYYNSYLNFKAHQKQNHGSEKERMTV